MMKRLAALLLLLAGLGTITATAGDKKQPDLKYDMKEMEKAPFFVNFNSAKVDGTKIKILLTFAKDLGNEAELVKTYFTSRTYKFPGEGAYVVHCYCFDEDNVLLCKGSLVTIEGEISGRKDDAFRAVFECSCLAKAKKIDLRLAPMDKEEKK